MTFATASRLGVALYEDTAPVEVWPGMSSDELDNVIRIIYKQVLGNVYVMKSERLVVAESQFKRGELSVREFIRAVAKSDLYRSHFYDDVTRYRFTELNHKHLLGRAPDGYDEMRAHSDILDTLGYEADIDSYLDSEEYQTAYGENTVPFYRGYKTTQTGKKVVGFTHLFALLRGPSGSDSGKSAALNHYVIQDTPIAVIPPSGGAAGDGWSFQATPASARTRLGVGAEGTIFRIEVTAYRAKAVTSVPKLLHRSNRVYLVPLERLSEEYQKIHKQGGVIASITPIK